MDAIPRGQRGRVVADRIRCEITTGRWPLGTRLPAEPELARSHGVGVNTVRRAVDRLIVEGLVERRQGSGTRVIDTPARTEGPLLIGVIVPDNSYYFPRVVEGIEQFASAEHIRLVLACSYYNPDLELRRARELVSAGVAGLIIAPTMHKDDQAARRLAVLARLGVPHILLERSPGLGPGEPAAYARTDTVGGGYAAVRHLAGLGRRRVGYMGRIGTATSEDVRAGYRSAVEDLGVATAPEAVQRQTRWSYPLIADYAARCRQTGADGVLCLGDREGAALVDHLGRLGLSVPDDVAVVTYDDEEASLAPLPLTAVSPPKRELGRTAVQALIRQIELGDGAPICQVQYQPRLAVRASCGAGA